MTEHVSGNRGYGQALLARTAREVERHAAAAGWDRPPLLFALVDTQALLTREPQLAQVLGVATGSAEPGLTPVEQEALPDAPLDEALGSVVFGPEVAGVTLVHEVLVLPPDAEAELGLASPADVDPVSGADADVAGERARRLVAADPRRREVRIAAAVLRDGTRARVLRVRGRPAQDGGQGEDDVLVADADLTEALAEALLATLGD